MQPGHDTKGDVLPGPIAIVRQGGNPVTNPSAGRKLLDVAELNAGSSAIISSGGSPGQSVPLGFVGNPVRLLDLHADSKEGQVVTVTMSQQLQTNQHLPSYPIRGIIEFGNGGAVSTVEFDIPPPDVTAVYGGNQTLTFLKSGVSLSVPAGSIRVYARNDCNAPFLNSGPSVIGSGQFTGTTFIDPTVFAHVAYNSTFGSVPPTRTVVLASNLNSFPVSLTPLLCNIPPFATGVRFAALDAVTTISSAFRVLINYDPSGIQGFGYNVAAGTDGHIIFGQTASNLFIYNTGPNTIAGLSAIFDIGNF